MPTQLLPTTVVGSYPQPDWLVDHSVLKAQTVPRVGVASGEAGAAGATIRGQAGAAVVAAGVIPSGTAYVITLVPQNEGLSKARM